MIPTSDWQDPPPKTLSKNQNSRVIQKNKAQKKVEIAAT